MAAARWRQDGHSGCLAASPPSHALHRCRSGGGARAAPAAPELSHAHLPRPAACRDQRVAAGRGGTGLRRAGLRHRGGRVDVIHYPDDPRPATWRSPVLALGNFDGLHRGHVKIVERIQRGAGERGGTSVVLTFDPHPPRVLRPDKAPALLMTKPQKLAALERAGVQGTAVVRFTREMSQWEPEQFVRLVLVEWLRVAEVWVGADFLFGRDRSGNFSLLRSLGAQLNFRAEKIDPIRYKDFVVSSTRIRRLVSEGRVDEAGALLGHHYAIDGTVVEGARRGREIGFPTANLSTGNELIPPHGVYATVITIDGQVLPGVTNIGQRPTFGDRLATTIETHVIDKSMDLYGKAVRVAFVQRLRDERKFPDIEVLQEQIAADVRRAARLFDRLSV
ncbi:MAG: bifunctional riboflavin kinase/FAD synthetase [Acidimicrobiia bacterium]|nr:bifunctional riboflavin kinase/FAD synthetase [Acidimicrobiia bacterium]